MKKIHRLHKTITEVQCMIILSGLCTSSLGAVYELPFLVYFWYLALAGMASMLMTSLFIGIAILFSRIAANLNPDKASFSETLGGEPHGAPAQQ